MHNSENFAVQIDEEPNVGNDARYRTRDSLSTVVFRAECFPWIGMVHSWRIADLGNQPKTTTQQPQPPLTAARTGVLGRLWAALYRDL